MTRFVVTFCCLCLLTVAASVRAAEVRLHAVVNCQATVVRLGDIAEIACDDPAIADDLAAVALFPAPGPGKTRQLDRHQVRQLLAFSGIDLTAILLTGSDSVVVQTEVARPVARAVPSNAVPRNGRRDSPIRLASFAAAEPAAKPDLSIPTPAELPLLVKRGEEVTIHSRTAGVLVTTSGKALADGALGSEIAIEIDDPRTKLRGRVAGPKTVAVGANQP
jgi:hypothetical protein